MALQPGMIVSNEPGYYKEGAYGIRIENLQVVTAAAPIPGGERPMHGFETLTLAPIDRRLIDVDLLTADERAQLDAYHARVLRGGRAAGRARGDGTGSTTVTAADLMSETNAEQVAYWNEAAGPDWAEHRSRSTASSPPLGRRAMARAGPGAGRAVLDVGCGCGRRRRSSSRGGRRGRARARRRHLAADARASRERARRGRGAGRRASSKPTRRPRPSSRRASTRLFSRFGVMFFADPAAAFANLRRALRPGRPARLRVLARDRPRTRCMGLPLASRSPHRPARRPAEPGAPGPFAFADPERLRGILVGRGLRGHRHHARMTTGSAAATSTPRSRSR